MRLSKHLGWVVLALSVSSCGTTYVPEAANGNISSAMSASPGVAVASAEAAAVTSYFEPGRTCRVMSVVAGVSTAIAVQATVATASCTGTMVMTGPGVTVCLVPAAPAGLSALLGALTAVGVYMSCDGEDGVTDTKVEPLPPLAPTRECGEKNTNEFKHKFDLICGRYQNPTVSSFDCHDLSQCIQEAGRCWLGMTHDLFECEELKDFGLQNKKDALSRTLGQCSQRYKELGCTPAPKPLGVMPGCSACFNATGTPRSCGSDPCNPGNSCGNCPVGYTCSFGQGICTPANEQASCNNLCAAFSNQVELCAPYTLYPQASGLPESCECAPNRRCEGDSACEDNPQNGLPQCVRTSDAPTTCICVPSRGSYHCHQDGDASKPLCAENCCAGNAGGTNNGNSESSTCRTYVGSDGRTYLADGVNCLTDCGGVLKNGVVCTISNE